jgi:hypothetical protein
LISNPYVFIVADLASMLAHEEDIDAPVEMIALVCREALGDFAELAGVGRVLGSFATVVLQGCELL